MGDKPRPISSLAVDELIQMFMTGTDEDQRKVMKELKRREEQQRNVKAG